MDDHHFSYIEKIEEKFTGRNGGNNKQCMLNVVKHPRMARVNQQHPLVHQEGWMVGGQETIICWVSVP